MQIGFIGAGTLTKTFGRHLISAGHEIIVSNSRGPETLAGLVADLGPAARAGTKRQATESDVVILATHWVNVPEALKDTRSSGVAFTHAAGIRWDHRGFDNRGGGPRHQRRKPGTRPCRGTNRNRQLGCGVRRQQSRDSLGVLGFWLIVARDGAKMREKRGPSETAEEERQSKSIGGQNANRLS
jgi:NADP oxidoreductase coenzyme F420-dependent